MNKFKVLFLSIIGLSLFFTSCKDEEGNAPVIIIDQASPLKVDKGAMPTITGVVTGSDKLKEIKFYVDGSQVKSIDKFNGADNKEDKNMAHAFRYKLETAVTKTTVFRVTAIDKNDKESYKEISIELKEGGGDNPTPAKLTVLPLTLKFNNAKKDECNNVVGMSETPLNGYTGTGAMFLGVFIRHNSVGYALGSPDAAQVKAVMETNDLTYAGSSVHTKFMKIESSVYDNATVESVKALNVTDNLTLLANGKGGSGVANVKDGDTYAMNVNVMGKSVNAVLKVKSVSAKIAGTASVELKYHYDKPATK